MTPKTVTHEYRQVNVPKDGPFADVDTYYVSRHTLIGTNLQVFSAWKLANGRTLDFTTVTYEEKPPVSGWLGRVGSEIDHEVAAMPIGDERTRLARINSDTAYNLSLDLIEMAFPEVFDPEAFTVTTHMGSLTARPLEA